METTYGERLLADAEDQQRSRRHHRRLILVFGPGALSTALGAWQTLLARQDALDASDAGLIGVFGDHAAVVGYALLLVLVPLLVAVRPGLHATAAAIALMTGPIAMPLVFGDGWRWWQRLVVAITCLLVIAARLESRSRRPSR